MKIYVHRNGKTFGPFSVAQLNEHLRANHFVDDDLACFDGSRWVKLSDVPGVSKNLELPKNQAHLDTKKLEKELGPEKAEGPEQKIRKPVFQNYKKILIFSYFHILNHHQL